MLAQGCLSRILSHGGAKVPLGARALNTNISGHRIIQALVDETAKNFNSIEFAECQDKKDPLAYMRDQFYFPAAPSGDKCIYLCGNSLGLQPKNVAPYVNEELEKWQQMGVDGHFPSHNETRPWVTADENCRDDMASIVGAKPVEVAIMNSLTSNLHMLMCAFYRPDKRRFKILMEGKAFPSDKFALQSQVSFHGFDPAEGIVEMWPREGETTLRTEDIIAKIQAIGQEVALVMFGGVQYYTGQLFDMAAITKAGHEQGCNVGFDLAHAVGNAPLQLNEWGCDFACWCTYKYMNSGPGNIAGIFVHERYEHDVSLKRLVGWWGHRKEDRFEMEHKFVPSPGAQSFMLSNPPVICIAALRASTDLFREATMERLRAKSVLLTSYLEALVDTELEGHVKIITPRSIDDRGAQLSLVFNRDVGDVQEAIQKLGVICDVRKPDVMRIAPAPLYNSFSDVLGFVTALKTVLK